MKLKDLLEQYNDSNDIPYPEFLRTEEWFAKRNEIVKRDYQECKQCGVGETIEFTPGKHTYIGISDYEDFIGGPELKVKTLDKKHHLEVHHKCYIIGKMPWEYKTDDLITLCNWCHSEFHQKNKVPIYDDEREILEGYQICDRCNGRGSFSEYTHVQGGVCFKCGGNRFIAV